ncbi:hypothetical protein [Actinomadura atramentaria]|uniref:hypothetical protein n=1 Tax=Actinomadura atramentaria TaxID=1990 RepID=UPI00039A2A56|nr:hypothetical protein [Actinomadura atramentaria]
MSLLLLHDLLIHAGPRLHVLAADVLDNPAPIDPTNRSKGVSLLLSYTKWGALITCGLVAAASGGLMAFGTVTHRPDAADRGKRALLWSLGGAVVVALAIPMVNEVFGAAA